MFVRERPILMSAPMVCALLSVAKTQTRRIAKFPSWVTSVIGEGIYFVGQGDHPTGQCEHPKCAHIRGESMFTMKCPYGKVGDRLWVRETWYSLDGTSKPDGLAFRADGEVPYIKWRSPIFMPRWTSRITLEITDVRVQRLQDISDEDCIAEGIRYVPQLGIMRACGWQDYSGKTVGFLSPKDSYRSLWESINGAGSWALNPLVWCISFCRV